MQLSVYYTGHGKAPNEVRRVHNERRNLRINLPVEDEGGNWVIGEQVSISLEEVVRAIQKGGYNGKTVITCDACYSGCWPEKAKEVFTKINMERAKEGKSQLFKKMFTV